ncbi:MAG: GNAT family N-acetyltransferase [Chloroflexota bacterium]|nr:GNAT family N-acetyltransferase [Chloroflexota bacterium]
MDDSTLPRALADMHGERQVLVAAIGALREGDLDRARPGGWTVGRILAHVIDSEQAYVRLLAQMTGRRAPETPAAEAGTAAEAIAQLARTRAAVHATIDGIDGATLYRLVRFGHEEYSPLSVLENITAHDREHRAQIAQVLASPPAAPGARDGAPAVDVDVRAAAAADVPRLTEIYNHYVVHTPITFDLEPFSIEQRMAWFAQHGESGPHRLLVAVRAGEVVGYAGTGQFRAKRAYDTTVETTIYCAPGATGLGIGRRLYAALFEALRGEDVCMAVAGITLPNEASCALHERFGFTRAGVLREVGRKFGRYWDVAWYERRLA